MSMSSNQEAQAPAQPSSGSHDGSDERPVAIVGIGASAGGLEAFQALLGHMPADTGMAFVLVQHMSPRHETHLPELLSKHTAVPVVLAADEMAACANHVYIVPGSQLISIAGGRFHATPYRDHHAPKRPVDTFLRSLAEDQRERAVAVVLSGTGSDGALGLRAVKVRGGLTLVQAPATARYDGMPKSALATGMVDAVLALSDMPARLVSYARYLEGGEHDLSPADTKHIVDDICTLLSRRILHDFSRYKRSTVLRRIHRRMLMLQIPDMIGYHDRLRDDQAEIRRLFRELLITVTSFFRDAEAFESLGSILGGLVTRAADERSRVRIWVPGCATGEEVYSLAIVAREAMERVERTVEVQIFATDIDEEALDIARAGRYPESISEHVSPVRLERFFTHHLDHYQIIKELRCMCLFSVHNLVSDPPFSRLDLISCRNLLIYLQVELQNNVIPLFHYALRPGGYLFLGPAEHVTSHRMLFAPVDEKHRIFQAKDTPPRSFAPTFHMGTASEAALMSHQRSGGREPRPAGGDLAIMHQRSVAERYAPPSVMVDADSHIQHICGRIGKYLELSSGLPDNSIIGLARRELRLPLRTALHKAIKDGQEVVVENIELAGEGETQHIDLMVSPVSQSVSDERFWLVVFREVHAPPLVPAATGDRAEITSLDGDSVVKQLESMRAHLQSTIEELETSNEELETSNEELETSNEELKSANEELQTAQEELQSVNEELETVNTELQKKVEEVDRAHANLVNLFESTRIPTIFLDRRLRIKQFTPAATGVFNLIDSDIGRPLADLSARLTGPDLIAESEAVVRTLHPREVSVHRQQPGDERVYMVRILPYRTLDDVIDGVVLTFMDVSELERATHGLRVRERQQAAVAQLGMRALATSDSQRLIDEAAQQVQKTLGTDTSAVFLLSEDSQSFTVQAGVGWQEGLVGSSTMPAGPDTPVGYTLVAREPVIFTTLSTDNRFGGSQLLLDHGVVSGLSYPISEGTKMHGVLATYARSPRHFSNDDANFLVAMANVLGAAIARSEGMRIILEGENRLRSQAAELQTVYDMTMANVLGTAIARSEGMRIIREGENRLRSQAAELQTVYDMTPVGLGVVDRELCFIKVNHALAGMNGLPVDEHIGQRATELVALGAQIDQLLERVIATGEPISDVELSGDTHISASEPRHWLCSLMPLHGPGGEVEAVALVAYDVTDNRRAEEALRASEEHFRSIFEQAPVGIGLLDARSGFMRVNRQLASLLGYQPEELIGRTLQGLAHPDDHEKNLMAVERSWVGSGDRLSFETRYLRKDGTIVWGMLSLSTFAEGGPGTTLLATIENITERKRYEAALTEADRHKDDFLAMLGHELRNPLAAIRNAVDLQKLIEKADRRLDMARAVIDRQVTHMARLIDGLLDVSRIARGKIRLDLLHVELCDLVRDVIHDYQATASSASIELSCEIPDEPLRVHADATRLFQVLDNLLSNALKFTEAGGRVEVRLSRQDSFAELSVKDSGIGIDPAFFEHLFEPFQQASQSLDRARGGLGLGLSLVKGVVELHGGTVSVHSEGRNRGAELRVRLPLSKLLQSRSPAPLAQGGGPYRVLVVDDNQDSVHVIQAMLAAAGHDVTVAYDGQSGLEAIRTFEPHVVLCDIGLPGGLSGYDVARAVRADPAIAGTRMVAFTGYGRPEDRDKALAGGFDAHLTKPVDIGSIKAILEPGQ